MKQRLDKMMSHMGLGSRRDAAQWVRQGKITVNGIPAASPDAKADPERDAIAIDGEPFVWREWTHLMLYKPAGVLTATEDARQETVLDLLPEPYSRMGLFPAGRLDKDTTGLLILTNDGALSHHLMSPRHQTFKVYEAEIEGTLGKEDVAAFAAGLMLSDGTQCLPAELEMPGPGKATVRIREGKYHQVKRMLASRGAPVAHLHRAAIGAVRLDPQLQPGEFRLLTQEEEKCLRG